MPASGCRAARSRGAKQPDQPADPIIVHPDVRRMLLTMRADDRGRARARLLDRRSRSIAPTAHPDPAARQEADDLVALMTPIVKAYFTDHGSACANLGVQIMGGHGYIREYGMEQLVRDARITQIYEGTNGIQALDLVGRKLPAALSAACCARFFHPVMAFIERHQADPALAEFVLPLAKAFARLQQTTPARRPGGPEESRRGGRRGDRLSAPVRAGGAGLHVGAHGPGRAGEARRPAPTATPRSTRPRSGPRASS